MNKGKLFGTALLLLLSSCGDDVKIPSNKRFYCEPPSKDYWAIGYYQICYFEGTILESNHQYYFVDTNWIFHGTIGENTHYSDKVSTFDQFLNKNVVVRFFGCNGLNDLKKYKWLDIGGVVMEEVNAVYEATKISEVTDPNGEPATNYDGMTSQWYLKEKKNKREKEKQA